MKRIISMIMVLCLVFSMFTVTSSAMSKKTSKYVKVKRATYQKYKKAYNNQKNLKIEIQNLEEENYNLKRQVNDLTNTIAAKDEEIARLQEELEDQKSLNRWVWNNIYSLRLSYKDKVWTIPAEYPTKYMIDGATYTVQYEEVSDENE